MPGMSSIQLTPALDSYDAYLWCTSQAGVCKVQGSRNSRAITAGILAKDTFAINRITLCAVVITVAHAMKAGMMVVMRSAAIVGAMHKCTLATTTAASTVVDSPTT